MYQYCNKETRDRLTKKSLMYYGRRGKWKKVMKIRGLSVLQIEQVLDQMINILRGTDERKEVGPGESGSITTTDERENGNS